MPQLLQKAFEKALKLPQVPLNSCIVAKYHSGHFDTHFDEA